MEHLTFKGTARYPSSRAISEAVEGVGGSANAATDRESTVYWARVPRREAARAIDVLGELVVRPRLTDADIDQERTVIVEEIRSYLDDPAEYCQMLIQTAVFGDGPLGREICGDEAGIRSLPAAAIRDFWGAMYRPSNTVVAMAGDLEHEEAVELVAAAFGSGDGVVPDGTGRALAPGRPARARPASATPRRRSCRSPCRAWRGTTPTRGTSRSSTPCWATACRAACSWACARRWGWPTTCRRAWWSTPMPARVEISAGVDPAHLPAAIEAILAELVRLVDEPVAAEELAKAKAYLSGGLELRMDDTRHLASWIGGQEALHDRVYTLDDALAAVEAVRSEDIQRLAGALFRDEALRMAVVAPARYLRGLDRHLRLAR